MAVKVRESVYLLRLPLPGVGVGHLNSYLVAGGRPLLIDTGTYSLRTLEALARELRSVGLTLCDVKEVVITHFHVDHIGLAGLLRELCDVRIMLSPEECAALRRGVKGYLDRLYGVYASHGVPRWELEAMIRQHPALKLAALYEESLPRAIACELTDGRVLEVEGYRFTVLHTPGHTPGHVCLCEEKRGLLVSGDLVLPKTTPHVPLYEEGEDPLGSYISSLRRVSKLRVDIVLPGHEDVFRDLRSRVGEILDHHRSRLNEVLGALRSEGELTGYEVARRIRWHAGYASWNDMPAFERYLAVGEALAHLRYLEVRGLVSRVIRGGVYVYRAAGAGVRALVGEL